MSPKIGQTISHYRILKKLGEGGMGIVYKAEDTRLERLVALKFLSPELTQGEAARKRFIGEARAASALDHPSICTIYEINETPDGHLFICMAYCDGETLQERIERGPVPFGEALNIVRQVAEGLTKAHDRGIVHRDIKPSNIIVTKDGQAKIMDFGLAKLKDRARITRTGKTVGTIAYMSPEQARGDEVDARSDIFSLGVVLYELLGARIPFDGDYEAAVIYKILNVHPEPLSKYQAGIPEGLQQIIDKALQKDVSRRYQSTSELHEDLLRVIEGLKPIRARLPRHYLRFAVPLALVVATSIVILARPELWGDLKRFFGARPSQIHIAVLPFENVGKDPANQAFCEGLMETITTQLMQLEQFHGSLWVVPASEVRNLKIASPSQAARVLRVNLAVTGAVQRMNDRFRVTLNLIDLVQADRPHLLSGTTIDNLMVNISSLQDETMLRLTKMLNVELLPEARTLLAAGGTKVSPAYYLYLQARGYLQRYEDRDNIDRAIALFQSAIEQDSLYALAYAGLGEAYLRRYDYSLDPRWIDPARKSCLRAIEINNLISAAHVTLGLIHSRTGAPQNAIVEFERALLLEPKSAEAYRGLAEAYGHMGMPAKAESTYHRAIEMKPDYWGGYYDLGKFLSEGGQYEKAAEAFRKLIELNPDNELGYNSLGVCYFCLDRFEEAREMFERSIGLKPTFRAYSNLGVVCYIEGRYADAAEMSKKALDISSTSYRTWVNLANAYYWLPGKREKSYETYRRAAELAEEQRKINPRDVRILASLAGYYAIIGEKRRALVLVEEALRIVSDNKDVNYFAGHAYEQLGLRDKAIELIGKAVAEGYSKVEIARDPFLDALRADERFRRLLESSGGASKE